MRRATSRVLRARLDCSTPVSILRVDLLFMDIIELYELLSKQGSNITIDGLILGKEITAQLPKVLNATSLQISKAVMTDNIAKSIKRESQSHRREKERKLILGWVKTAAAYKAGKLTPESDKYRWIRFKSVSREFGLPYEYQSVMRISNKQLSRMYKWARSERKVVYRLIISGDTTITLGNQQYTLTVSVHFRSRSMRSDASFEIFITGYPNGFAAYILPELANPVWQALSVTDPAIILASDPFNTVINKISVPLESGVNFIATLGVGTNVKAMMGKPTQLLLCGRIIFTHPSTKAPPIVDLATYPSCSADLGVMTLYGTYISIRTSWTDGSAPDLPGVDNGSLPKNVTWNGTDYPDIVTEIGIGGSTMIEGRSVTMWSHLLHDNSMLAFNFVPPKDLSFSSSGFLFLMFSGPVLIKDLNSLNPFVGGKTDWLTAFAYKKALGDGHPYILRGLTLFYDLYTAVPVSVTIHVESTNPFGLAGLDAFKIEPFYIGWNVAFPGGNGTRAVYVTADGILHADGLKFYAAVAIPEFTIYASAEDSSVDLHALRSKSFVTSLEQKVVGSIFATYTSAFIELRVKNSAFHVTDVAITNSDGDEEVWDVW